MDLGLRYPLWHELQEHPPGPRQSAGVGARHRVTVARPASMPLWCVLQGASSSRGAAATGPAQRQGYSGRTYYNAPPQTCMPQPFSFERREAAKTKGIARRRFEEDLLERMQEEERFLTYTFKANPVPASTYLHLLGTHTEERKQRCTEMKQQTTEQVCVTN